jgi:cbb3-type cytochrome oxidase subunit 3
VAECKADNLYPAVRVLSEGGAKETKKSMQSFLKAFVFAILIIFFLLILLFDLKDINKAPASFNEEKLLWLNQEYIKNATPEHLIEHLECLR